MRASIKSLSDRNVPKAIEFLFEDQPLLSSERREDYDALLAGLINAVGPNNEIHWILLKDLRDLIWDIQRERKIRAEIIAGRVVAATRGSTRSEFLRQRAIEKGEIVAQVTSSESQPNLAQSITENAPHIEASDRRLAGYEARRYAILQQLLLFSNVFEMMSEGKDSKVIESAFTRKSARQ
ncbi:hypothetical protein [Bradyrhizobium sp. URHA0013]|uniref:hypothetical protein n=1 Tax=Bradyrhizobium sp. URHA0013 TaxID=1380352 RepID=UPI0004875BAE|nr:hypothetical protein [Bradyrhizobium sp. URHA0013]